ncbi:phage tail protein [Weissella oryzae SG25]|uniref:Phage tail protein n=1 Tax=Weissella oryzae (strain DSM 25784 / JCM 18191 / LMG 30913 / SG25) TaxID=1329250 RepID=A0A069CWN9_WEIOS|nr:hypothetical protein [Weissella oryzae]GAK31869.1 phage tail protein [Weissella oryzae SG25]
MSLEREVIELRKEVKRLRNSNVMLSKSLTDKRPSGGLFRNVKLDGEVRQLNTKYGFQNDAIAEFVLFPNNDFPEYDWRLWGNKDTIYSTTLEEHFRALALSVFGTKKNQDLMTLADQEEAIEAYEQFKNLWLQFYRNRLERITN